MVKGKGSDPYSESTDGKEPLNGSCSNGGGDTWDGLLKDSEMELGLVGKTVSEISKV